MVVALGAENMFDRLYREHFDFRNANGDYSIDAVKKSFTNRHGFADS